MPQTANNSEKPSILKSTREAKGLTLEIVHEATKIPMDALKAIEEGYSSRILSPFYYRGFIKIYSEFLGLDVGQMYKQYGIEAASKSAPLPKTLPKSSFFSSTPGVEAADQIKEWFVFILKPKNLQLMAKVAGFLALIFALFKIGGCIISHTHKKAIVHKQTAVVVREKKVLPPAVVQPVRQQAVGAPSQNNTVEVAVRAVKDTWIRVKTDDKVVFEATLSKGSMESWSADERIELSGKNIDQLDMEVNGRHIGFLGGGERRIRKVWITREGLTVKK